MTQRIYWLSVQLYRDTFAWKFLGTHVPSSIVLIFLCRIIKSYPVSMLKVPTNKSTFYEVYLQIQEFFSVVDGYSMYIVISFIHLS